MHFSQSALFFDLHFQFLIFQLLICVHSSAVCFLVVHLVDFPEDYCLSTWLTFLLLTILLTWPIQFNRLVLTNESTPNFQRAALIISLSAIFTYFNSPNIFLKTFLSKAANRLA
jgi:hypothetical protein